MPILTYFQGRLKDYQRRPRTALLPQKDLQATEDHHLPSLQGPSLIGTPFSIFYDMIFPFSARNRVWNRLGQRCEKESLPSFWRRRAMPHWIGTAEVRPVCARYIWFGEGGVQFGVELRYSSKSSRKSAFRQFLMLHSGGSPTAFSSTDQTYQETIWNPK